MQQNATLNEDSEALSPDQIKALELLLSGETVSAAAKAVGIDRSTVHRWLREDFEFQAALNRKKRELADAVQTRLLTVADKAAEVVGNAVHNGDLSASLAVLRGTGALSGTPVRPGPEDPAVLRENAQVEREESELLRTERKSSHELRRLIVGR